MYSESFIFVVRVDFLIMYVVVMVDNWLLFFKIVLKVFISEDFFDFFCLIMMRLIVGYFLGGISELIFVKSLFFFFK